MAAEAELQHEILKTWGARPELRLWRANTGVGWFANGQPARKTDPGAYPVKFGVKGQWDVSGILWPSGRRIEIEVKAPGEKLREEQERWGAMIERYGGLCIRAWSLDDVDRAFATVGITR